MVPTKSEMKRVFQEVPVQKASVFNIIQICTSIFLGFIPIRKGSSCVLHKRRNHKDVGSHCHGQIYS